ncbi:ssDNA exonuclease, 5'--_ 3'-specific [Sterolibacterium denitrificans]|uniref:Single-stranded-DNA-specific exonuclease RecJ n=1 Tax=Sterolibacterium denitrificans TaxID=157592 RepID=A0A7Z7HR62_9PROT|nr:single-stranded-DNA-specific exonuclease RecJ [Sterolibacterium denitrificans]SMB26815.1 ssDNA exonuclease, 5'--> 3'-specific [Sterolibacterium denitrificans]
MTRITTRRVPLKASLLLEQQGVPALLARLYAARGITRHEELDTQLAALLPPSRLRGAEAAATLLADAIAAGQRMLIVADYDCDGATACAIGLRALRSFGARVDYLVPNRFEYGYGLTPEIVQLAAGRQPDLLITVDNGIASIAGVAEARRLGMRTLITDHHLPGQTLPEADVIVNPNQPGCGFPSKALAGCGVMFYVMLALRSELRKRGAFDSQPEPNLAGLLDLVALGTVADVVPLDHNNRILVAQGLARMRAGKMQPGVAALFRAAGRRPESASTFDLGFGLGPRLNAAGRLADMALGIECLSSDDGARALNIAQELNALNQERRSIEAGMQDEALLRLEELAAAEDDQAEERASITLFDPDWHQGVIGILASRIKERLHRPVFVLARGNEGELKGSGRSIPGLHLRDALDLVAKQHPDLLLRFGGHAAAAGVTVREADLPRFEQAFEAVCRQLLAPADLTRTLESDGALETANMSLASARLLRAQIWGQGFPQPLFADEFQVENQRILKERHLKLTLSKNGVRFDAIQFNFAAAAPSRIRAAYRLDVNEYNGVASVQLLLEHFEAA